MMAQPAPEPIATSPKWKRPDEVMQLHWLKVRKKALQARMIRSTKSSSSLDRSDTEKEGSLAGCTGSTKRKNPFRCGANKKLKDDPETSVTDFDLSSDNTIFHLLNSSTTQSAANLQTTFASILSLSAEEKSKKLTTDVQRKQQPFVPVDWTLKTKLRFISRKPFAWTQQLRTSEESSGVTGFVRCLEMGHGSSLSLDTSPNAQFHQCCLIWQHPALPWLSLYPRLSARVSSSATWPTTDNKLQESLHLDWCESFRSLFQLVRARQCPYFYVCANKFTCLFRAAGICGVPETHALLTPTTKGFREVLKEEDIIYTMPLSQKCGSLKKRVLGDMSDAGYDTLDSMSPSNDLGLKSDSSQEKQDTVEEEDDEEEEEASDWMERMGVTEAEIKRLKKSRLKEEKLKDQEVDRRPASLVYVAGVEAQALFNFLMNCKSCIATTGPLAGIPPTLLSPVAFSGATLKSLKARQSIVRLDGETFHSIDLQGPILPHTLHNLCHLLEESIETFSATFANVETTRAFSCVIPEEPLSVPSVFGKENLSDCGLKPSVLERLCNYVCDTEETQVMDDLKYKDSVYSWT